MQESVSAQSGTSIVISEFRFRGTNGGNDEFIELFNASMAPVNVGGWMVRASNNTMPPVGRYARDYSGRHDHSARLLLPRCQQQRRPLLTRVGVTPNLTYATGFADDGGVALTDAALQIIDQVGHGGNGAFGEGQRLPTLGTERESRYRAPPRRHRRPRRHQQQFQ